LDYVLVHQRSFADAAVAEYNDLGLWFSITVRQRGVAGNGAHFEDLSSRRHDCMSAEFWEGDGQRRIQIGGEVGEFVRYGAVQGAA
jgi:hypothetical protein